MGSTFRGDAWLRGKYIVYPLIFRVDIDYTSDLRGGPIIVLGGVCSNTKQEGIPVEGAGFVHHVGLSLTRGSRAPHNVCP